MARESHPTTSVLIVDADAGIRHLIATVLGHAGFRTVAAGDPDSAGALLATSEFAVIVRDLNLAPRVSERSLQQFAATAPELLPRTVILSTTPERAATVIGSGTVFAIVGKPFDIENLVHVVRACARGSRKGDGRGAGGAASPRRSRRSERGAEPSMKLDSLRRFVVSVPGLQLLLSVPVTNLREASLRAEMRRTLAVLAATLTEAAHIDAGTTRAAALRAASMVAARLATVSTPASAAASGRDH